MTISEVRQAADDHTVESWHRREPALPAVAVLGIGPVAAALTEAAHALLADGAKLHLVADPEYLVVLGEETALPWVDGARYLGWDGNALTLTTHRVLPAADLWREAALTAAGADAASLVIVLPDQVLIAAGNDADHEDHAGYAGHAGRRDRADQQAPAAAAGPS
ncbi:hypothetical protein KGQ19_40800 [Catenulispora sp. NL8]|uniref:MoxR-vWA-beta-propeller ternary system domain-containing protein n=1 Tax=Catenulispora pinistramenti TaxID=2705254 RepID=A0ABS5L4D5_9ACTN|nr:hypothetical protein [Catenulispora pinistramenti]MBS2553211.1 hypothetical protein [Catenulispora pinistramenti]